MLLQKSLPDNAPPEECKLIAELIPLPQKSPITVHADGAVRVNGNYNDVHDNETVKL